MNVKSFVMATVLVGVSFSANSGVTSNQKFKEEFLEINRLCLLLNGIERQQKCLSEMRSAMMEEIVGRQQKAGEVLGKKDEFNEAVKMRNEAHEDAKGKTPRW